MTLPLEGIRVIDLTRVMAGPYCSMALGDLGADVVKVEVPGQGDDARYWGPPFQEGESYYFLSVNRNKRSMTLNLKTEEGKEIFRRLVAGSDVVMENFRPGTMEHLGFGYPALAEINPRLVYSSISGYGSTGPQGSRAGYDYVLQAEAGHMSLTGHPGQEPVRIGIPLVDLGAAMWAMTGIMSALYARERTGKGQFVETSLMEAAVSFLCYLAGLYFATGVSPRKSGSEHLSLVPYQAFRGSDGRYFVVCVGNDAMWRRFCETIGLAELGSDPRFADNTARMANKQELQGLLQERFLSAPAADWAAALDGNGVPAGMIRELEDVFRDPQVLARNMIWTGKHQTAGSVRSVGLPLHFSDANPRLTAPPPLLGQHTGEILSQLGYTGAEIQSLRARQVV